MLSGGQSDMEMATGGRERALSSSQANLPIPTFKQQAEESSFNKLLISKIHEIVKSNPLTKQADKSKFSAASINNMKSPMSGNSPRNQMDVQSTTSKAQQNIMSIFKMLGEKKNSPTIIKPDLTQSMSNMLSTLQSKMNQQKSGFSTSALFNNKTNYNKIDATPKVDPVLERMLSSKAPEFTGRNVSEVSNFSRLSRQPPASLFMTNN